MLPLRMRYVCHPLGLREINVLTTVTGKYSSVVRSLRKSSKFNPSLIATAVGLSQFDADVDGTC